MTAPKGKALIIPVSLIAFGLSVIILLVQGGYKTGELKTIQDCNSLEIKELSSRVEEIDKNIPTDLDKRLRGIENNIARILEKLEKP